MEVGQKIVENRPLHTVTTAKGTPVIADETTGSMMVYRDKPTDAWQPVSRIDQDISGPEYRAHYGGWRDQEITSGHWPFKKVVRPLDGVPQDDEVTSVDSAVSGEWAEQQDGYNVSFQVTDASIQKTNDFTPGNLMLSGTVTGVSPIYIRGAACI